MGLWTSPTVPGTKPSGDRSPGPVFREFAPPGANRENRGILPESDMSEPAQ